MDQQPARAWRDCSQDVWQGATQPERPRQPGGRRRDGSVVSRASHRDQSLASVVALAHPDRPPGRGRVGRGLARHPRDVRHQPSVVGGDCRAGRQSLRVLLRGRRRPGWRARRKPRHPGRAGLVAMEDGSVRRAGGRMLRPWLRSSAGRRRAPGSGGYLRRIRRLGAADRWPAAHGEGAGARDATTDDRAAH